MNSMIGLIMNANTITTKSSSNTEVIEESIAITIDMRNSSKLISSEYNLDIAEKVIIEFNELIKENCGITNYDQSTGDGFLLIYSKESFVEQFKVINQLITEIRLYVKKLSAKYSSLNLGYGMGMQKSKVKVINMDIKGTHVLFMVGDCVNTSSKYAYLHNRSSLKHENFMFDGILTTKTMRDFLESNNFIVPVELPKSSDILAYKLEKIVKK